MMESRQTVDLLIHSGIVVTMDQDERLYEDGAVAVRGTDIVMVGPSSSVQAQVTAHTTLDASGQVVLPGLVNTHTHAAMTIFRGLVDDIPLEPWLQKIWRVENEQADADNVRVGSELAFVEMIRSGTTTAADMYWHRDVTTEVARRVGFRLINGPSFIDFVGPDGIRPEERESLAREYLGRYQNDPLIGLCVQAHATYSVPTELLEKTGALAQEYDALFVTHASESAAEVATIQDRFGKTPLEYLDSLGLLGPRTLLAHCVHLRDDEIQLLAERSTSVAHCPESNLKIGAGIARISDMLKAGVNVGLGTDGAATNNDLDLWGEMHTAALLQKGVRQDPTAMPAPETFRMATIGGASALNLEDKIGSLEVGKRADVILVDFDQSHLIPLYDVYSHLVYAVNKADVRTVLINGQVVMRDRELLTLDEKTIKAQAREAGLRIRNSSAG